MNLLIFILDFHRDIEINDFQTKAPVDDKIVGLDIPVSDTEPVKIRDALDETPADLNNLAFNLLWGGPGAIHDGDQFR